MSACQQSGFFNSDAFQGVLNSVDPFRLIGIPVTTSVWTPPQVTQADLSSAMNGNGYATSATIAFPGSWSTQTIGSAFDLIASNYDVSVGNDIWKGNQKLWSNTATVGNLAAAGTAALIALPYAIELTASPGAASAAIIAQNVVQLGTSRASQFATYLFAQGDGSTAKGALNANNYFRVGMGFDGSIGREVFRVSIGSRSTPLPQWLPGLYRGTLHINLWKF